MSEKKGRRVLIVGGSMPGLADLLRQRGMQVVVDEGVEQRQECYQLRALPRMTELFPPKSENQNNPAHAIGRRRKKGRTSRW
jgi:hypothetical protein